MNSVGRLRLTFVRPPEDEEAAISVIEGDAKTRRTGKEEIMYMKSRVVKKDW